MATESVPSVRAIARIVLVTAAIIAGLYLLYKLRNVIGLVLIAIFFALAIAPAVNWLDRHRVPRPLAILLVYLSIAASIFGIGLLVVPPGEELDFLHPLPVERLWGVGRVTAAKLHGRGLRTVGQIAALDEELLIQLLGRAAGRSQLEYLSADAKVRQRDLALDLIGARPTTIPALVDAWEAAAA